MKFNSNQNINQSRSQSDFIKHEIEDTEFVRNPYPYEVFIRNVLSSLQPVSKKLCENMQKISKGYDV